MKNTITLLILFAMIGLEITAQTFNKEDIVGTWKIVNVEVLTELPKEQKQTIGFLKSAFLKSKFKFEKNQSFSFDIEFQEIKITKGHWKYNNKTNSFLIQEWKDKDSEGNKLMEILVKQVENKTIFYLSESFFLLEVERE